MPRRHAKETSSDEEDDELFSYLNSRKIVKKLNVPESQQGLSSNEISIETHSSSNHENELLKSPTSNQPVLDIKTEVISDDDDTDVGFVASKVEQLYEPYPLACYKVETNDNCEVDYNDNEEQCESADDNFENYEYVLNDFTDTIHSESTQNLHDSNAEAQKIVTEASSSYTHTNSNTTLPTQNVLSANNASHVGNVTPAFDDRYYLINEKDWMSLISSLQTNKQNTSLGAFNLPVITSQVMLNSNESSMTNNESSVPGTSPCASTISERSVTSQCKQSPVKDAPLMGKQNVEVIYLKYENGQLKPENDSPVKNVIVQSPKKSQNIENHDVSGNHSKILHDSSGCSRRNDSSKGLRNKFVRINNKLSRVFVKDDESFVEQVVNEKNELTGLSDSEITDDLSDNDTETAFFIDLEDWKQSECENRSDCKIQPINIQDNYYSFIQEHGNESHFIGTPLYFQDGGLMTTIDGGGTPSKVCSPVKLIQGKVNSSPIKSCMKMIALSPCKSMNSPLNNSCPSKTEVRNCSAQIIRNLWEKCKDDMPQKLPGAINIESTANNSPSETDTKHCKQKSKDNLISCVDHDQLLEQYMKRGYTKNDASSKRNKDKMTHSVNSTSSHLQNIPGNTETSEDCTTNDKTSSSSKVEMKIRNKVSSTLAPAKNEDASSEGNTPKLDCKSEQGSITDTTLDNSDNLKTSEETSLRKGFVGNVNESVKRGKRKEKSDIKDEFKAKTNKILDTDKNKSVLKENDKDSKKNSDGKTKRKKKDTSETKGKSKKLKQSPEQNSTLLRDSNSTDLNSSSKVSECSEIGKKKLREKILRKDKNDDKLSVKVDSNKADSKKNATSNVKKTTDLKVEKSDNLKGSGEMESAVKVVKNDRKGNRKKSKNKEEDIINTINEKYKKSKKRKKSSKGEKDKTGEVNKEMNLDKSELEDYTRWRNIKSNKVDFLERLFQMKQKEALASSEGKDASPDTVNSVDPEIKSSENISEAALTDVNCEISKSGLDRKKGTKRRGRKRKIDRLESNVDVEKCSIVCKKEKDNSGDKLSDSIEVCYKDSTKMTCKTCEVKESCANDNNCACSLNLPSTTNEKLANEVDGNKCLHDKGFANDSKTRQKHRKRKSKRKTVDDISSIKCSKYKQTKALKRIASKSKNIHRPRGDKWKEMLQDGAFKFDFNKDLSKTYKPLNVKELVRKILNPHCDLDIKKQETEKKSHRKRQRSKFKHPAANVIRLRTMSDNEDVWFSDSGRNASFPAFKFSQTKNQSVQTAEFIGEKYHVELSSVSQSPARYNY